MAECLFLRLKNIFINVKNMFLKITNLKPILTKRQQHFRPSTSVRPRVVPGTAARLLRGRKDRSPQLVTDLVVPTRVRLRVRPGPVRHPRHPVSTAARPEARGHVVLSSFGVRLSRRVPTGHGQGNFPWLLLRRGTFVC